MRRASNARRSAQHTVRGKRGLETQSVAGDGHMHAACPASGKYHIWCIRVPSLDKHVQQDRTGLTQLRHRSQCYQKHALLSRTLHVVLQQQPCERAGGAEICSFSRAVKLDAPENHLSIPGTIQSLTAQLNSLTDVYKRHWLA